MVKLNIPIEVIGRGKVELVAETLSLQEEEQMDAPVTDTLRVVFPGMITTFGLALKETVGGGGSGPPVGRGVSPPQERQAKTIMIDNSKDKERIRPPCMKS
jgi:hypothetical protein